MDSVMKRLNGGNAPPPRIFGLEPPLVNRLVHGKLGALSVITKIAYRKITSEPGDFRNLSAKYCTACHRR